MKLKNLLGKLILSTLILSLILNFSTNAISSNISPIKNNLVSSLIRFGSIEILNDGDFADYGFPGYGNESHPYIIEEYEIISSNHTGIHIQGTSKYFIIQGCYIDAEYIGINIVSVANGTAIIQENSCVNNMFTSGIYIQNSSHTLVTGNTCSNNINNLIIYLSNYSIVTENYCTLGNSGIYLRESISVTVANNTIYDSNNGVYVDGASFNEISNNLFHLNDGYGVWIDDYVGDSTFNIIHHNKFVDNNIDFQTSQGWDQGSNNIWYDTTKNEGNYWSEWTVGHYFIDGAAHSIDYYPISETVISEFEFRHIVVILVLSLCLSIVPLSLRKKK